MSVYLKAKKLAQQGKFDEAWEVAQKDEGLLPHVTKEAWIEWVKGKI